jgi:hypothetical protein
VLYAWKTARFARLAANWDAMWPAEVANVDPYADVTDYFGCVYKLKTANT